VLGFMVESNYRRSLVLSDGDYMTFVNDRLALGLLTAAAVIVAGSLIRHALTKTRGEATA
jgi:putative tricarboxylic transport membrane protein